MARHSLLRLVRYRDRAGRRSLATSTFTTRHRRSSAAAKDGPSSPKPPRSSATHFRLPRPPPVSARARVTYSTVLLDDVVKMVSYAATEEHGVASQR